MDVWNLDVKDHGCFGSLKTPNFLSFELKMIGWRFCDENGYFSAVFHMQVMLLMLSMMIPIKSCDSGRLRPFLVQQRELCERADLDTTAEAAREVDLLQSVCFQMGDVLLEPFRF